jgi:hypothetical protein
MPEPATEPKTTLAVLDAWDPLAPTDDDVDMFAAAQKREIRNILKSYTGYYDLFSEMIQNALDAVEKRSAENEKDYKPTIVITINIQANSVTVTDNGCSMSLPQFKRFLKPNFSFKDGPAARGNKGVGATYLAFGFNHLKVATKPGLGLTYEGRSNLARRHERDHPATYGGPYCEWWTSAGQLRPRHLYHSSAWRRQHPSEKPAIFHR